MHKFKVGDRVKIVNVDDVIKEYNDEYADMFINETGVIIDIINDDEYPYRIEYDKERLRYTDISWWDEEEITLYEEVESNNKFLFHNDTQRDVYVHPATIIYGCKCDDSVIKHLETREFILPEGTIPWVKMWDYGVDRGLQILVSPRKQ